MDVRKNLDEVLDECCISRTAAIKEMGISRNAFYKLSEDSPEIAKFIKSHENDWRYSSQKLINAMDKAKKNQSKVSKLLGIHYVTLNLYIKKKQLPTRKSGHYQKIRDFCRRWFEY